MVWRRGLSRAGWERCPVRTFGNQASFHLVRGSLTLRALSLEAQSKLTCSRSVSLTERAKKNGNEYHFHSHFMVTSSHMAAVAAKDRKYNLQLGGYVAGKN